MVAISLYRGNLHRVPDAPRRWLMPNHKISLKDFKSLVRKREKALSRLRSTTTKATTSNPNPNPNPNPKPNSIAEQQHEFVGDNDCSKQKNVQIVTAEPPQPPQTHTTNDVPNDKKTRIERLNEAPLQHHRTVGDAKDQSGSEGEEEQRNGTRDPFSPPDTKSARPEIGCNVKDGGEGALGAPQVQKEEQRQILVRPPLEISNNEDLLSDKEKKKKDLEQNLKVLNEKKHNLVQMLKQILNAEEEIKRRNIMRASAVCPPVTQQVEATTDLGSNPRQIVNRVSPEANCCGDLEGESEDVSNHNAHTRQSHQMRSTSPSARSPLRKVAHGSLQHNAVPITSRPSLGGSGHTQTTSSPSSFSPLGPQGHPASLPPLSVSGTHCTPSPSPAASGGTSVFRDSRITSPSWN